MAGVQRHEALQDLSRHHHHALVLAMNLNRARASSEDTISLRQQVLEFWEQGGNQHFREEEEVLLPIYAKYKTLQNDVNVIRMLLEHVQIRMLVQTIQGGQTTTDVFHELGLLLKGHVHLEEQVIFPEIQLIVPEPDLLAVKRFFHEMQP